MKLVSKKEIDERWEMEKAKSTITTQLCPKCGSPIWIRTESKKAICNNCGFKDPCCE